MSSSAFFIEAAANTVMVLSCARARRERRAQGSKQGRRTRCASASWRFSVGAHCARAWRRGCEDRPSGTAVPDIGGARTARRSRRILASRCGVPSSPHVVRQRRDASQCAHGREERHGRGDADRRRIRLHHRRRGLGRLRAGEPPVAPIRTAACCCSKPAAATTGSGFTSRSAICSRSAIRARTGCSRPSRSRASTAAPQLSARQGDRRLVRRSTP